MERSHISVYPIIDQIDKLLIFIKVFEIDTIL